MRGGALQRHLVLVACAVRWERHHSCEEGALRCNLVLEVAYAVRWEPPHLCGGGALQRSDRYSASFMRFSAGHSTDAANTIDRTQAAPPSATTTPSIPDIFKDSPSGHDFSRAARLANRRAASAAGGKCPSENNSALSKGLATSSRRTPPSGTGSSTPPAKSSNRTISAKSDCQFSRKLNSSPVRLERKQTLLPRKCSRFKICLTD